MNLPTINTPDLSSSISKPARPGFIITDGEERVGSGAWEHRTEAEAAMASLCWHPRRFAGPFRVEEATLPPVYRWDVQ